VILLVEDDLADRELYQTELDRAGFTVQLAADGAEALVVLGARVPDLVVTDWKMPRVDGRELVLAIRSTPRWQHVPIIMLSGLDERDLLPLTAGLEIGHHFKKPVPLDMLVYHARRLVGRP
jgi:DNA-binding response OmpR family regulator